MDHTLQQREETSWSVPSCGQGQVGSNVDLATESVNLIREKALYASNAAVVKTANEMYGSLLDIFDDHRHRHERDRG